MDMYIPKYSRNEYVTQKQTIDGYKDNKDTNKMKKNKEYTYIRLRFFFTPSSITSSSTSSTSSSSAPALAGWASAEAAPGSLSTAFSTPADATAVQSYYSFTYKGNNLLTFRWWNLCRFSVNFNGSCRLRFPSFLFRSFSFLNCRFGGFRHGDLI